jgi:hypothetical protein
MVSPAVIAVAKIADLADEIDFVNGSLSLAFNADGVAIEVEILDE